MWGALVAVLTLAVATVPATQLPPLPAQALGPLAPMDLHRGPVGGDIPAGCMPLALQVDAQGRVTHVRILQSSRRREIDRAVMQGVVTHRFAPAVLPTSVEAWRALVTWSVNGRSSALVAACAPIGAG
ncbi:energy transducer TonB [Bacillus subtilis subsp. subtilis]|nr:energy transducer TonB [Bacillus subtilis subsp. subtilis]